jgi:hypothetical protein
VHQRPLVAGLAAAFGAMTLVLVAAGLVFNYVILVSAVLFGAVTYVFWEHASGRLAARVYRRVEQFGAADAGPREPRAEAGGFGAGPKADWDGGETWREQVRQARQARGRARQQRARGGPRAGRQRRPGPRPNDGPTAAEAYETLGLTQEADEAAVREAYRERVKEVHPDAEGGDEEAFKRVSAAYERLT